MMIAGISISSLVIANLFPRAAISKRNIGIFVVDQAPMKIRMFMNLTPFFMKIAANGKAPYRGSAAAEPIKIANKMPFKPEHLFRGNQVYYSIF